MRPKIAFISMPLVHCAVHPVSKMLLRCASVGSPFLAPPSTHPSWRGGGRAMGRRNTRWFAQVSVVCEDDEQEYAAILPPDTLWFSAAKAHGNTEQPVQEGRY